MIWIKHVFKIQGFYWNKWDCALWSKNTNMNIKTIKKKRM